ncbi:MAG TPA: sialidase family protein [Polyangiaceae bacterium]|nr:sialidase family protein [Polyangiaceae bacterium]
MSARSTVPFSLAALLTLPAILDCQVCPCRALAIQSARAGTAIPAAGAARSAGTVTSAPYGWNNVVILGGGFVSGVIFSPAEKGLVYARTDVGGAYRWNGADGSWVPLTDEFGRDDSGFDGIESMAPDPVDSNRVYAAVGEYVKSWAGNGAMLRSTDRGGTWSKTDMPIKMGGNEYGRSNGERLAIDPNRRSTLYFGSRADGLWKSTDSSVTWNRVTTFPAWSDPNVIGITFVVFDKRTGSEGKPTQTIYAGVARTDGTLYVSTDGGASWKLLPNQPTGLMASHAAFDGQGMLYVTYGSGPGPNDVVDGAVWKCDPAKGSFTNITPAIPEKAGGDSFGYGGLAVDPSNPGTVMVTTIDRWTKGDEIYRTIDSGKTWKALGPKIVRDDAGAKYLYWDHDKPSGVGWMGDIDIDPFDPGHVLYVTGQGIWGSDDASAAEADKPTHWSFRDRGLEETVVTDLVSPPSGPPLLSMVGDLGGFRHDDLATAPPTGMFHNPIFGSGAAIDFAAAKPEIVVRVGSNDAHQYGAYSADGGSRWTPFASMAPGKGSGSIAVSADGTTFLWAPKDGPPAISVDRGTTWVRAEGAPEPSKIPDWAPVNLRMAADRVNPKKLYIYDALRGRGYSSTDGGNHFVESHAGLPSVPDYNLSRGSIRAVPGIEGDVWLTTGKELYHSTDSGKSYDTTPAVTESDALGFGKPGPGKKYPALYLIGRVNDVPGFYRSDDAGESWVRINDNRHQFGFAGAIAGDPRVYGRVYVGTGGRGIVYGDPK